ncbi:hypothetical protein Q3G72_023144 [Acer saccharum]|nr:hypothetical protein Q3G72_023144 [Acer saccharum]
MGEEKGVQEHFEAQLHVDDLSDNEGNTPAEKHPPIPPKRRSRKAAVLKSPYADTKVKKPKKLLKFRLFPKLPQSELNKFMSWLEEDDSTDFRLFDYANGVSPKFATPWVEIDKVYIPLNYESNHWILAEVDFVEKKIIVYDSKKSFIRSGKKFIKFMELLSTLLPLLLHAIDFFSKRLEIHHREDMTPWVVERCENVPQQEKSDCAVFVIKFAEHLIHGESIDTIQAEKAKYFRQQLCLNLWRSRKAL